MKKIFVKDFCVHCMTRGKGEKFYKYLRTLLAESHKNIKELEIDFSGVEYVSPSFLDESVWKLAEENYQITIHDPDQVIKDKLDKIKIWTKSNINVSKKDRYFELAAQ